MKKFHLGNLPPSLQRRILEAELDISNGLKANLPAEMPKEQTRTFLRMLFRVCRNSANSPKPKRYLFE
jgi:hypothetical protein